MTQLNFRSHGKIEVTVDDDLVTLDIEGPCNLEFFQEMEAQLIALRPSINPENHTGLIILRGEALAPQEAMAYFTQYLKTVRAKAVAIDLEYALNPATTEKICAQAYNVAGINHRFFFNKQEAIAWLRACMQESPMETPQKR